VVSVQTRDRPPGTPVLAWSRACAAVGGLGVLAGFGLVCVALVAGPGLTAPGYVSETADPMFGLAAPYAVGMITLALGVLLIGLALAPVSRIATGLMLASAVGATVSGAVPCSPGCPLPPYEVTGVNDLVHGASSIAGLAACALAMLWLVVLPWTPSRLRRLSIAGAVLTVPLGLAEAAYMLLIGRGLVAGAIERVLLCCVVGWLVGVAALRSRS
jgi:hypothetical protein